MHVGGPTSLAEAGVSPHIIQAIGQWKSDTWQIYVCKNPVLIQAMIFGGKAIHKALSALLHKVRFKLQPMQ